MDRGQRHRMALHRAWQAAAERLHGKLQRQKLRDECLNEQVFSSLAEAKRIIECWRVDYNTARPHSSLDYLTPDEFAANWRAVIQQTSPDAAPRLATGRAAAVCGASASRPVAAPPSEGQNENRLNL